MNVGLQPRFIHSALLCSRLFFLPFTLSLCYFVTLLLCYFVTLSLCYFVTLLLCYFVTLGLIFYLPFSFSPFSVLLG